MKVTFCSNASKSSAPSAIVVSVKDGFARNFLLPRAKALRATSANMKVFEVQRAQIEARNADNRVASEKAGEKLNGSKYVLIRQAGESGQLLRSSPSPRATWPTPSPPPAARWTAARCN